MKYSPRELLASLVLLSSLLAHYVTQCMEKEVSLYSTYSALVDEVTPKNKIILTDNTLEPFVAAITTSFPRLLSKNAFQIVTTKQLLELLEKTGECAVIITAITVNHEKGALPTHSKETKELLYHITQEQFPQIEKTGSASWVSLTPDDTTLPYFEDTLDRFWTFQVQELLTKRRKDSAFITSWSFNPEKIIHTTQATEKLLHMWYSSLVQLFEILHDQTNIIISVAGRPDYADILTGSYNKNGHWCIGLNYFKDSEENKKLFSDMLENLANEQIALTSMYSASTAEVAPKDKETSTPGIIESFFGGITESLAQIFSKKSGLQRISTEQLLEKIRECTVIITAITLDHERHSKETEDLLYSITQEQFPKIGKTGSASWLSLTPDGSVLPYSENRLDQFWNNEMRGVLKNLRRDTAFITSWSFNPEGIIHAIQDKNNINKRDHMLWASVGQLLKILNGQTNIIISVAGDPAYTDILTGFYDTKDNTWCIGLECFENDYERNKNVLIDIFRRLAKEECSTTKHVEVSQKLVETRSLSPISG